MGADIIALSFVRTGADVEPVHKIMEEEGIRVPVIAKIEKPQAVDNLQDIIDKFDGIMVARGDLGVELPFSEVPRRSEEGYRHGTPLGKARYRGNPGARVHDRQPCPHPCRGF